MIEVMNHRNGQHDVERCRRQVGREKVPDEVDDVVAVRPSQFNAVDVWIQPDDGLDPTTQSAAGFAFPAANVETAPGVLGHANEETAERVKVRVPALGHRQDRPTLAIPPNIAHCDATTARRSRTRASGPFDCRYRRPAFECRLVSSPAFVR